MLLPIVTAIPVWVVPLLFGLFWVGQRASRDRSVRVWLVYALPMLGLLSLSRAQSLPQAEIALAALFATYAVGAIWGYGVQKRWILGRAPGVVHLRGEWLTLVTVLGLFAVNFASGMVMGIAPALGQGAAFALTFGMGAGALSGTLLGRAVRVARWPVGVMSAPKG